MSTNCKAKITIKADVEKYKKILDDSYNKILDEYYNSFLSAIKKLSDYFDLSNYATSELISNVVAQTKRIGADISSGAVWLLIQLLDKYDKALQQAITIRAFLYLGDDLKKRIETYRNLSIQLNVVKTCIGVIQANIFPIDSDVTILNRVIGASRFVREALIRSRQLIAIWENTGVYHEGIFNKIEENLNRAQEYLILPEIQTYQNALQEYIDNLGIDLDAYIDVNSLLDIAAAEAFNPSQLSGRAAIALEPLFNLLTNVYDDRIARIVIAYKLCIQAVLEISRLTTAFNPGINSIMLAAGQSLINITDVRNGNIPSNNNYFTRFAEPPDDTLLEQNGRIVNKILALQDIQEKWDTLKNVTSPFIQYIDEATIELSTVYKDMKETINSARSNSELYSKSNAWSTQISDIQTKLLVITPPVNNIVSETTTWIYSWNRLVDYIDSINVEEDIGVQVYSQILSTLAILPTAISSSAQASSIIGRINVLNININRGIKNDQNLLELIENLNLEEFPDITIVDKLIEFCDEVFPVLSELIRNCDIEKISKAVSNIKLSYTDSIESIKNSFRKVSDAIVWVVEADKTKNALECLDTLGVDINFKFSIGGNSDQESDRDMNNIKNFKNKKDDKIRSIENLTGDDLDTAGLF